VGTKPAAQSKRSGINDTPTTVSNRRVPYRQDGLNVAIYHEYQVASLLFGSNHKLLDGKDYAAIVDIRLGKFFHCVSQRLLHCRSVDFGL
jgi:hypothetical protein